MCIRDRPETAGATLVVSDNGDILSPKYAPETMAPARSGAGTPIASPIPINASPMVLIVPKDVPVIIDASPHNTHAVGAK